MSAELGALGTAIRESAVEKAFVRQYFDNGLAVYDAAGKRFGVVADYDRPGGGFVVHLVEPTAGVYIPMRLVRKVRRGKVYLAELARNLTRRSLDEGPRIRQPHLLLRLLSGLMPTEKASV
ncbi:MAG TPA: hypothetical protein VFR68_15650 [Candidatus Dormibacteraeota bacterium]|nr:hypothetical protein [Candidatus Dormibacteraeota bacterium]